jgi:hypothetical protein
VPDLRPLPELHELAEREGARARDRGEGPALVTRLARAVEEFAEQVVARFGEREAQVFGAFGVAAGMEGGADVVEYLFVGTNSRLHRPARDVPLGKLLSAHL